MEIICDFVVVPFIILSTLEAGIGFPTVLRVVAQPVSIAPEIKITDKNKIITLGSLRAFIVKTSLKFNSIINMHILY
jgi:hypothetical protein